ncbi:MAG: DUF4982 domain-containing protein, partial [Anaerolineae bacterium]
NCDSVELFLNDVSFGEQVLRFPRYGLDPSKGWGEQDWSSFVRPTTADLHMHWTVPYAPGVLKAVGKRAGEAVCVQEIVTAGPAAQIELLVDRETIVADGRDVAHLTVQIHDAQGNFVPNAGNRVTFDVQGPARLIGVDNGNPVCHESFQSSKRRVFNGLCLAIVQSTTTPGIVTVTATAQGLVEAHVTFEVC